MPHTPTQGLVRTSGPSLRRKLAELLRTAAEEGCCARMIWPNNTPQSTPQTTDWDAFDAETWAPAQCRISIDAKECRFLSWWSCSSSNRPDDEVSWAELGSQTRALKVLLRHLWSGVDETITSSHKWIYEEDGESNHGLDVHATAVAQTCQTVNRAASKRPAAAPSGTDPSCSRSRSSAKKLKHWPLHSTVSQSKSAA